MKTVFLYFAYAGDEAVLRLAVERLLALYPHAVVMVADDAAAPMPGKEPWPAGVQVFRTRYERGGTGKGLPAVLGELRTMDDAMRAAGADYCVKLDPDVWVNDLMPLLRGGVVAEGEPEPDFVGCEGGRALLPMGCAYRVSKWAVKWCLEYMVGRKAWPAGVYAEALTIYHMLALSRLPLALIESSAGYLSGFALGNRGVADGVADAGIIHCGEPYREGGQLTRATRELTLTRMLLLAASE